MFGKNRKQNPFGMPFDIPGYGTPGIGDGHNQEQQDILSQPEVGAVSQQPGMIPTQEPVGQQMQPQGPKSFWGGGEKFRWQDGLAAALAAVGDGLSQHGGGQGGAVQMLTGGRSAFQAAQRKAQEQAAQVAAARQRAMAAGLSGPLADLMANGDAKFSDVYAKPEGSPEKVRTSEWYRTATPEQRRAFDIANPIITSGYGSAVVPRDAFPQSGGQQTTAPAPGTVEDGHRFIGGDPSDQNNWKPIGGVGLSGAPRTFR